jgi:glyoxylase I family protein
MIPQPAEDNPYRFSLILNFDLPAGALKRFAILIFMLFTGLEHTAIASPHPKNLADWYVKTLGFIINYEYDGNYFVKAPNGAMLEIIPAEGPALDSKMKTPGLRHLAVMVANFDEAHADLKARGVNLLGEPVQVKTNRLLFFTDCDGNILHLIQREKPLP